MEYQQFLNWLRKKKILELYINEYNKFQQKLESDEKFSYREYWMEHVYRKTNENVFNEYGNETILESFKWIETGNYEFWSRLNREFQKLWNTNSF